MQIFAGKTFQNPIKIIEAFDNKSFIEAFSQIEDLRKRHYLLGYIRYEAKDIFLSKKIKSKYPLLYFEVYESAGEFCLQNSPKEINLIPQATIDYKTYKKTIESIKKEIANGNTYEINYTYDYKIETEVDGFELYKSILPRQITPYNAYIKNKYEEILSFSPELFFEIEGVNGNKIRTKPMKGTVQRGKNEKEDKANIEFLRNDIKNRAENVMIVDLLRNDLGRIAKTGTVKVDKLFEIETHKTVHQMTSEITAELEENTTLFDIFKAIFPCGSITGAPKINTMEIIDKLEGVNVGNRNVYCGAVGLISPKETVFSVPIRILQKLNNQKYFLCRVGGAIVWDSTAIDEWEETLTKIKFLQPEYKLAETILVKNGNMKYKTAHFARMKKTAKALGFKFHSEKLKIKPAKDGILRILLNREGTFEIQELPIKEIQTKKVSISKVSLNSKELLLQHKTTFRPWYDEAMKRIKAGEIFDEIFFNEKGELTEGARSNIILEIGGKWFTPTVSCGLLNGVLRQKLIKQGKVIEKELYFEDLERAQKIYCINSVRGIVEVTYDSN